MEPYDFLHERVKPIFKGDYQDFSSKNVEGYSLFVSEYKKPHVQAMVRAEILELLQNIEVKYSEVSKGEANLHKSQISRWYVNGFTDMYNGSRRNDLKHPLEHHDYLTLASKFKPVEDLNSGTWNKDKFRKYAINLGRHEGILFYVAERDTSHSTSDSPKEEANVPIDSENNLPEEKVAPPPAPVDIDFSTMPSYQSKSTDGPDLHRLYSYLRDRKVVINADENLFIQYVTHAYFSPLYQDGNKVNIRYSIAQLKAYYDKEWLKAVCENINVSEKYITQRSPSEDFRKNFPSLIFKK